MNDLSWKTEKIIPQNVFLYFINPTFLKDHLDFQLRSFVDPKPVQLGENYMPLKFSPSLLD